MVVNANDCDEVCDNPEDTIESIGLSTSPDGGAGSCGFGGCTRLTSLSICAAFVDERVADELRDDIDVLGGAMVV